MYCKTMFALMVEQHLPYLETVKGSETVSKARHKQITMPWSMVVGTAALMARTHSSNDLRQTET